MQHTTMILDKFDGDTITLIHDEWEGEVVLQRPAEPKELIPNMIFDVMYTPNENRCQVPKTIHSLKLNEELTYLMLHMTVDDLLSGIATFFSKSENSCDSTPQ